MNSLILDTSTEHCIAAIAQGDQIAVQEIFSHKNRLSETLLPSLQSMIEKYCHFPKNIHTVAFGIGPGSYTGTRLGAAVAKTLAFGLEIPTKTFASPLAFLPNREGSFAFVIPARNGQFYVLTGSQTDIHRGIQNEVNGNVGASNLQQAQPLTKQGMWKHILDAASCKGEDADEASGHILKHDVYRELRIENPFFMRQEELDNLTKADYFICSQVDKLPEALRNRPCFPPTPNLPLLAHWLSKQEPTPLEQIELVYLGTP